MRKRVTAIIVTYNRKNELLRCIKEVLKQTYPVENLIIIDNASTDGTIQFLKENGVIEDNCVVEENSFMRMAKDDENKLWLFRQSKNEGGAGGFYRGLQLAHEQCEQELYWMMDDDGYPSLNCLEVLVKASEKFEYCMPVSIDIDNEERLSWAVRKKNGKRTLSYQEIKKSWGSIMEYVTPFNGLLLSDECVNRVGYINKDFFIWGDEYEHYWRCVKQGYQPITLLKAKFYHPSQKLPLVPIMGGLLHVPYVDSKLRMVCLARNYTYIYRHYNQRYKIPLKFLMYTWFFLVTRHLDFGGWRLYILSVKDGFTEEFSRHKQYF